MGSKLKRDSAILWAKKILICSISLIILGFGCGLNIATAKGADPITVFYEGLNKLTSISIDWVTWILNGSLVLLVFFINKKYVHIGTVIYVLVLGSSIKAALVIYSLLHIPHNFFIELIVSIIGCILCFIGIGGFMSINIGIDPWTAVAIIASEKTKKPFKFIKIIFDTATLLLGWAMGGKIGIITVLCAVIGGPLIQKSAEILDNLFSKMLKSSSEF